MADKELRKMNRAELIEIIYALQQNEKTLRSQVEELQSQVEDRLLYIENAGSIAEAAISLNHVFEDAQSAAGQYLDSIQNQQAQAVQALAEAREQADEMIASAQAKMDQAAECMRQTEEECRALREQTAAECDALQEKAEQTIERQRASFLREVKVILRQYPELADKMRENKKNTQDGETAQPPDG